MGSWNKTCGLSNLYIHEGEDVLVFVLQQVNHVERTYSTALWRPVIVPFYAKYADYGVGSNEHGIAFPWIMDGIKGCLFEQDLGENVYHDIAVKRADFDVKLFYDAVHEHRLYQANGSKPGDMLDFVMFRKDVVDEILANYGWDKYVGEGGECGYQNYYRHVNFARILGDLPAYIALLRDEIQPGESETEKLIRRFHGLMRFHRKAPTNLVADMLVHLDHYRYSHTILLIKEIMYDLLEAGKDAELTDFMTDLLKGIYLDIFMEATRRHWQPGGHEGSQACDPDGYRVLAEATLKVIAEEERRQRAEDGDDDEI